MKLISALMVTVMFSALCFKAGKESPFRFAESDQGVALTENGQKVFFYQKAPVTVPVGGEAKELRKFSHYIHPLYNLEGEVITEAQPESDMWHPHHRGIFWGWHRLAVGGKEVGDSRTMKDFGYEIRKIQTRTKGTTASLILDVDWKSPKAEPDAFVTEHTVITVHALQHKKRVIDFEIRLKANAPEVTLAGLKDTVKGYGGFSIRLKLADSMLFRGQQGVLKPVIGQLHAGPWVDFSTPVLKSPQKYDVALFCHPAIPNFPSPWLLRSKASMQNPAFPGWEKYTLPVDSMLTLSYRLIIHEGNVSGKEINDWFEEYKNKKE